MTDIYTEHSDIRCPRCGGFLYSAIYSTGGYMWDSVFENMVACLNCGRYWRLDGSVMVVWPARKDEDVIEVEPSEEKRKKVM